MFIIKHAREAKCTTLSSEKEIKIFIRSRYTQFLTESDIADYIDFEERVEHAMKVIDKLPTKTKLILHGGTGAIMHFK